ncbi:hypothetical protein [Nocardioides cynanchi]|uniref:hypothetical protein n=1 Tax=Nocardioides cynanchi TaxID=2558918 RepID=UPI0012465CE0|nr:hypothetical protein [Nocardioides cynanchi]
MARVHPSLESITGLSWLQAVLLGVAVLFLANLLYTLILVLSPPTIANGTTDWKGDPVQAHYRDWRP